MRRKGGRFHQALVAPSLHPSTCNQFTHRHLAELGIKMTPMHPETELRNAGAIYESQSGFLDFFATHVVIDDERRFVTGQNQNSAHETAYKMMVLAAEVQR